MKITSLKLENFRSWDSFELEPSQANVLIGPNGTGKTNILEAIWITSTARSWRTRNLNEMISWEKGFSRINIKTDKKELELFFQNEIGFKNERQLKIDGVKKKLVEGLGVLPLVLFTPETLDLVGGSPSLRRKFLDIILSQVDRGYAIHLLEYQKILKERNKLLYFIKIGRSKVDELEFWDNHLVDLGIKIIKQRENLFSDLSKTLSPFYVDLSGKKEELKLLYKKSVGPKKFQEELAEIQQREITYATSLLGPHRDDFKVMLNGRDLSTFGSRGEFRTAVLALKMAEVSYIEKEINEKPILLLDDIFSELDIERRAHLAKLCETQQTFITTTDLDHIEKGLQKKAKVVEIK